MEDQSKGIDRDFVEFIVKNMVDYPEDVKVTRTVDNLGVLITLAVNKADMGRVIGAGGQAAQSLRILLRIVGAKSSSRVNLKIDEPEAINV